MFSIFNIIPVRCARRSSGWSKVRKEHLKLHHCCAACGKKDKLEVHHKLPVHKYPELELNPANLVTLCADPCHIMFGHLKYWKSWNVDVQKDCDAYYKKLKARP